MLMIEMQTLGTDEVEMVDSMALDPIIESSMGASLPVRMSNAMNEDELITVLSSAQEALYEANSAYENAFKAYAKEPFELQRVVSEINSEMVAYVRENHSEDLKRGINQMAKTERSTALRTIRKNIMNEKPQWDEHELKKAIESVKR